MRIGVAFMKEYLGSTTVFTDIFQMEIKKRRF